MALLPYLLDYDIRPRRTRDFFGLGGFDLEDLLLDRPQLRPRRRLGHPALRSLTSLTLPDVGSTIKADKDKFQVNLDVQHFAPEEITVKTVDGCVVVEGKHEEKEDDHGYVSRSFKRRYTLPEDCNPEAVESKLSTDGVLTILAPKASTGKGERAVPITHTGPVRRKQVEDQEVEDQTNGDAEEDVKTPQQKRRKR
ncbi:alpha-crystallin A chain [Plutella xylostella]|uniref:alpha-crystallin A chain n=1 Tax=Plutella xylostella TaxID=51655 RepID=UPI002032845A|nr:alpha-crystallin A chain [Plutella xylostella]